MYYSLVKHLKYTSHLTAFSAGDSSPHLLVNPVQLMVKVLRGGRTLHAPDQILELVNESLLVAVL